MERREANHYRYGDKDRRPFFLNADHYLLADQVCRDFADTINPRSEQPLPQAGVDPSLGQGSRFAIPEENRLLPVDAHLSFYSDLLGFTTEVSNGGMDSLPDYFGGAFVAAAKNPKVRAYMLSDSCFAFAPVEDANDFLGFVSSVFSAWLSDGLIPQCSIGYGSFVERNPFPDKRPKNFFGTQMSGTAVADAVGLLKDRKPYGSRILLSPGAWRHWPALHAELVVSDGQFKALFPERPLGHCLFDCVYYLLCLRDHKLGTRPFDHYVWSCASRARAARIDVLQVATNLAGPHCAGARHKEATHQIDTVLRKYESVARHPGG